MRDCAFNIRQLCYYKPDKYYRVYMLPGKIHFHWLANQSVMEMVFEIVNVYMLGRGKRLRKYFMARFCKKLEIKTKEADQLHSLDPQKLTRSSYFKKHKIGRAHV